MKHFALFLAGILVVSGLTISQGWAGKGAKSPYDTLYVVLANTNLRESIESGSAVKAPLAKGTKGIVMRWCRDEFDFGAWAFGSLSSRRSMLKKRVCEVEANGIVGFVDAKYLDPM